MDLPSIVHILPSADASGAGLSSGPLEVRRANSPEELLRAVSDSAAQTACVILGSEPANDLIPRLRRVLRAQIPVFVARPPDSAAASWPDGVDDVLVRPLEPGRLRARLRAHAARCEERTALLAAADEGRVLLGLTRRLTASLDHRDILDVVLRRLAQTVGAARVSIVLSALDVGDPDAEAAAGPLFIVASDDPHLRDATLSQAAITALTQWLATGKSASWADAREHPLFDPGSEASATGEREALGALALHAVSLDGQPVGVLIVRLEERGRLLTERERRLLRRGRKRDGDRASQRSDDAIAPR